MTNSITYNAPAPVASDSANEAGNHLPQPVKGDSDNVPAPDARMPDLVKTVGGTTFEMYFHFSQTSRETFTDKVLRLIQSDE